MCAADRSVSAQNHLRPRLIQLCGFVAVLSACSGSDDTSTPVELSVSVTASPLTIEPGETTTLTWTSTGADSVSVSRDPGGALLDDGPAQSTFVTPALTEPTTFRVTAIRGSEEASATVRIEVRATPPTITAFTTSDDNVSFGDTVTVAWETENADRIELLEDDRALAVRFDTADAGSFSYVADRRRLLFGLRAINASDTVATSSIVVDVALPDTSTVARRDDLQRTVLTGRIAPGATAVIELDVLAPGTLVAEAGSPRLQRCDSTVRLLLVDPNLRTVGETQTIQTPGGAPFPCGRIDAFYTPQIAELTMAGTYLLLVISEADIEVPYEVMVRHYDPGCGNGHVDPGELCDDGNQIDDDRCSETCEPNPIDPVGATVTFEVGTFLDPFRRVRIAIEEPSRSLTATVTATDGGDCQTNTLAGLVLPGGNSPLGNGPTVAGCGGIIQPRDAYAADLAEGTYDVFLLNPGFEPGPGAEVSVTFDLTLPECGNGITEISEGEDCDDANDEVQDGCLADCSFEPGIRVEQEPNNELANASPIVLNASGEWTSIAGRIIPANDFDFYEFDVPPGAGLEVRTYSDLLDPASCNGLDTVIQVGTSTGVIAENDDRVTPERSLCSYLNIPGPLTPGTYQLLVVEFDPAVQRNRYFVDVRLTP